MIGSAKQEVDKFGANVIRLARINLGASKSIDGKKRVTNTTGDLSKSLSYRVIQNRSVGGQFASGFDIEFLSSVDYASFIEQGVKGSESTKPSASKSPFKFKGKNIKAGVLANWIKKKPIRLRDASGKFKKVKDLKQARKQLEFLLGRAIATKGISARNFISESVETTVRTQGGDLSLSMAIDFVQDRLKTKSK